MRKREGEMPATGAGLIRYFKEEAHGYKISPKLVLGIAIGLIVFEAILRMGLGQALLGF
jgi:preprotein translocase subunit Sec61beta